MNRPWCFHKARQRERSRTYRFGFQAALVAKKNGTCNDGEGDLHDTIVIDLVVEFEIILTFPNGNTLMLKFQLYIDQEFKVSTPKGYQSQIRIYLTSGVDFVCEVRVIFPPFHSLAKGNEKDARDAILPCTLHEPFR